MALAIFDLDNTLIGGDSDHAWGEFLVEEGIVDAETYKDANDRFYAAYQAGTLDIHEYLEFALAPLAHHDAEQLEHWRQQFMAKKVQAMMLPKAEALIARHRDQGDTLLIITATNRFVTQPIADALGIPHLIASEPEHVDGRYTGKVAGIPSFQAGKIARLDDWLSSRTENMNGAYFYSDSHNDLPLLEQVTYPVAVDPDERLLAISEQREWPVISLR